MSSNRSTTPRILRGLETTLNDATYEVDSPYKQKVRDKLLKESTPIREKSPTPIIQERSPELNAAAATAIDPTPQQLTEAVSGYLVTISGVDYLSLEMKDGERIVVKTPEADSPAGEILYRNAVRAWSIQEALDTMDAMKSQEALEWDGVGRMQKDLVKGMGKSEISNEWEKDLSIRQVVRDVLEKLSSQDPFSLIMSYLTVDYEGRYDTILQKVPRYGYGTVCSHPYCSSPKGRTPRGSFRVSLEPPENRLLSRVPTTPLGGKRKGEHGGKSAQWFCHTCWEDLCNGVGLITQERLRQIYVDLSAETEGDVTRQEGSTETAASALDSSNIVNRIKNGHKWRRVMEIDLDDGCNGGQDGALGASTESRRKHKLEAIILGGGPTNSSSEVSAENRQKRLKLQEVILGDSPQKPTFEYNTRHREKRRPAITKSSPSKKQITGSTGYTRRTGALSVGGAKKSDACDFGELNDPSTTLNMPPTTSEAGSGKLNARAIPIPKVPSMQYPNSEFLSFSQALYSRLIPESRGSSNDRYTLPLAHKAALFKWQTTILRQQINENPLNLAKMRALKGDEWRLEDPDHDDTHDELYWLYDEEDGQLGQIHGLVDPGGLFVDLNTADCYTENRQNIKELSEVLATVDRKIEEEWVVIGNYKPPKPVDRPLKLLVVVPTPRPIMTEQMKSELFEDSDSGDDSEDDSEDDPREFVR